MPRIAKSKKVPVLPVSPGKKGNSNSLAERIIFHQGRLSASDPEMGQFLQVQANKVRN